MHGWLVLDKPVGMTSTHAVSIAKRVFRAKRAGHAGTLDPLASGLLPIAFGEATKTVPFVMEGRKRYVSPCGGARSATPTTPKAALHRSDERPIAEAIRGLIPSSSGQIAQMPPRYSAIKIEGERAYDLARDGELVELRAAPGRHRPAGYRLGARSGPAVFAAECGKGPTCVRSPAIWGARSVASATSRRCAAPRSARSARTSPSLAAMPDPGALEASATRRTSCRSKRAGRLPSLRVSSADAGRLARGQAVLLRGRDAPVIEGWVGISAGLAGGARRSGQGRSDPDECSTSITG